MNTRLMIHQRVKCVLRHLVWNGCWEKIVTLWFRVYWYFLCLFSFFFPSQNTSRWLCTNAKRWTAWTSQLKRSVHEPNFHKGTTTRFRILKKLVEFTSLAQEVCVCGGGGGVSCIRHLVILKHLISKTYSTLGRLTYCGFHIDFPQVL